MKRCIECDDRRAARGSDYCRVCVWLVPRAALIAASAARIAKPRVLARVAVDAEATPIAGEPLIKRARLA